MSDAPGGSNLPARRISSQELEAVIRRAVEIQSAGEWEEEGLSEAEALRIGRELGITPETMRRALLDVRSRPRDERGVLAKVMGPGTVRALRTVRRPAAEVGLFLEEYLVRCEYMVVQRRFPDRTRYVRARGVAAALGRAASKVGSRHTSLDLQQLDVGVAAVDEGTALVELSVDLAQARAALATGGVVGGGLSAGFIAVSVLATPILDPLALLALPALGGILWGSRAAYTTTAARTEDQMEAFLDRLEHGELRLPAQKPEWRKQLGI